MTIGWEFEKSASISGGNDGAIDTFMGKRIHSTVREIIQNSLDARDKEQDNPVRVDFSLKTVEKEKIQGLDELKEHLDSCVVQAENQGNQEKISLYKSASDEIAKAGPVMFLCVSDYNTVGLHGSTDLIDGKGPWIALIKGIGLTQKPENSLGSFGHGSKAPFTMAKLRTIFYLTETLNSDGNIEVRFQGKSLLQSHEFRESGWLSSGIGYFGERKNEKPLVNDSVPLWASELRSIGGSGKGTSILIPHTNFDDGLFPETVITVLANFFYVIKLGKLVVTVDGKEINQSNLDEKFKWAKEALDTERDFIDYDYTKACFQTIETIVNADHTHEQEIPGFGRIDWFLRVDHDDLKRGTVAIARESGMFITRSAPQLQRFQGLKPFDMFVRVDSGEGSKALVRMEDPQHSSFELSRIEDLTERKIVKKKYDKFIKKIKDILDSYAKIPILEEETLGELGKILFGVTEGVNDSDSSTERGSEMFVSRVLTTRAHTGNKGRGSNAGKTEVGGDGQLGKGGKKGGKVGGSTQSATGGGKATIEGGSGTSGKSGKQVESLRVNRLKNAASGYLQVYFNCYREGQYTFQLCKVGDADQKAPLNIMHDGEVVPGLKITVSGDHRQCITLELQDKNASNYALEGWLSEIK